MEEMTKSKRQGIKKILDWLDTCNIEDVDKFKWDNYVFLGDIYKSKMLLYGPTVQDRLNEIRQLYLERNKDENKTG